jgi:carbon-monoxide dehydrogenase large subunit
MGQRIRRLEDSRFLRGKGLYVESMELPGALHATFVRSPYAHARIVGIDTSAASSVPGAQVFTAADVELPAFPPPPIPGIEARMTRPFLASEVVRFVGDIVAVVLSESRADGTDAAELVMVDYEPLPVVVDPEEALSGNVLLYPELGTNVCASHPVEAPDGPCSKAATSSSQDALSQRLQPVLEARGCVAAATTGA